MYTMAPKKWLKHRRVLLNLQVGRWYLQVWLWGVRLFKLSYVKPTVAAHEFLFWRPGSPPVDK
jgi:hypothetical protein